MIPSGNLEPPSESKYRRPPRPISLVGIIIGMVLGLSGGLIYAWVLNPVVELNTEPWQLNENDKAQYVVAIMLNYAADGDPVQAVEQLVALRLGDDPIQAVADVACDLATTGYVDSASGLQAIRNMMTFYQLQGRSGCADTLIPASDQQPTLEIEITLATPTLVPPASKTPTPPNTGGATATPTQAVVITSAPQSDFVLASINTFCDTELSGIIEVFVQDFGGDGIPGQAVRVRWDDGEDTFYTGLKPERGPAYADFQMEAGRGYIIEMPGRSDPSSQPLNAAPCTTDTGDEAITSYRVVFRPAG
jgi:hypothetical protein